MTEIMKKYPVAERKIANIALSINFKMCFGDGSGDGHKIMLSLRNKKTIFYLGAWMLVSGIVGNESWVVGCGGSEEQDEPGDDRYIE